MVSEFCSLLYKCQQFCSFLAYAGHMFGVTGNHEKEDTAGVCLLRYNKKVIDIVILCLHKSRKALGCTCISGLAAVKQ